MLGDRAGTAGLMALSVKGHFVVSLLNLTSHPDLRGDRTRGLPNTPELLGKDTGPSA